MTASSQTRGHAAPGRLAVLYDGDCELCRAMLQAVRQFDNSGNIDALDFHDEQVRAAFPELSREQLMEQLHAVDDRGRVFRGARAINEILRRQGGVAGALAYLWYIPGYAWLADWQYQRIARSRYRYRPSNSSDSLRSG
ncbi:MAG: DUF393 domain-containing protein [Candidatus Binataceae bacterium]|nr:DUF393 domain-containing protein [Candidatus Binataceae bacterium]